MRKVLILGASGMLGNTVFRVFASSPGIDAIGSVRAGAPAGFPEDLRKRIIVGVDVGNADRLAQLFEMTRPSLVINCVGLIKQLESAGDPLLAISINALLPHRLARLCGAVNARLIHISTDCVFAGTRGGYREEDAPDSWDLYGRSKLLGEVDYPHAVTLRTSIIGHEMNCAHGLVEWFLSQESSARGYTRAIFSGLPTVELARVIRDFVVPRDNLHGIYHVSAKPIAKYDLLRVVAQIYDKSITITPDDGVVIDRSLDSTRFSAATGYVAREWPELIRDMKEFG